MFLDKKMGWSLSSTKRKGAILTLLFFSSLFLAALGVSLQFPPHLIVLDNVLNSGRNYMGGFAYISAYAFGAVGMLLALILAPVLAYVVICGMVSVWNRIFSMLFGKKTAIFQGVAIFILLTLFAYQAVYIPSMAYNKISVKIDTPSEMNINKEFRAEYNDANQDISMIRVQELIIRNESDTEIPYVLPQVITCLHYTKNELAVGYVTVYQDENGRYIDSEHDRYDREYLVLRPHSETRFFLEGFRDFSRNPGREHEIYKDNFDEILLVKGSSREPSLFCEKLDAEQIAAAQRVGILR